MLVLRIGIRTIIDLFVANNAKVTVNGQYYGVYTNVERLDKEYLQRNFIEDDGNLYQGGAELAFDNCRVPAENMSSQMKFFARCLRRRLMPSSSVLPSAPEFHDELSFEPSRLSSPFASLCLVS